MSKYARMSKRVIPKCGMTKVARQNHGLRQCPDIGLWALDNGMGNCVWRTEACGSCYNRKTVIYKHMAAAWAPGGKDDQGWQRATPESFQGLNRVRLNTRGDAFPNLAEVNRVAEWVEGNPSTKFWIVTRGWQTGMHGAKSLWYRPNDLIMKAVEKRVMIYDNAYVQASIDDWTGHHWKMLKDRGWNTMYFSRDLNPHPAIGLEGANIHKCRKTWDLLPHSTRKGRFIHRKAVCKTCRNGCFAADRVDTWLKFHY